MAGQREDAMEHPGRFIREEGHFEDREWANHRTQADGWRRSAAGWKAKADQARKGGGLVRGLRWVGMRDEEGRE